MRLTVDTVGAIRLPTGEVVHGVILTGSRDDVAEAAGLWSENVTLVRATSLRVEPSMIFGARLALPVLRDSLRSLIEVSCDAEDASGALCEFGAGARPRPHSLSCGARETASETLRAIRVIQAALLLYDIDVGNDGSPAWLDEVIAGDIEI